MTLEINLERPKLVLLGALFILGLMAVSWTIWDNCAEVVTSLPAGPWRPAQALLVTIFLGFFGGVVPPALGTFAVLWAIKTLWHDAGAVVQVTEKAEPPAMPEPACLVTNVYGQTPRKLADQLVDGIVLRVDQFFEPKPGELPVRNGSDLFSAGDRAEIADAIQAYSLSLTATDSRIRMASGVYKVLEMLDFSMPEVREAMATLNLLFPGAASGP